MDASLIKSLQNPSLYPHEVKTFEVVQTHLSWVILTGSYAYKIKKALNLGFQDFTTLDKRKHFCELEVSLNKRLAPQVYIDVVPITGTMEHPEIDGKGPAIEYAIKMNQFDQNKMLSALANQNRLTPKIIKSVARQLAYFHQRAEKAEKNSDYGSLAEVVSPIRDNFSALFEMPMSTPWHELLNNIQRWTEERTSQLTPLLERRKQNGFIRATHGDVHLGNIVLINDMPVIFDCIEFNENFRWTDTMNDVSFLFMDLIHKGYKDLAYTFINQYFEISADYEGLVLLHFYACYRAMVRAKVTGFTMAQADKSSLVYAQLEKELAGFIQLANDLTAQSKPSLTITMGISGTGKSSYTEKWLAQNSAIRLRSDVIRKHLFNMPLYEPTPDSQKASVYSEEASKEVFQTLRDHAKLYLQHGQPVIIDATCIKQWQRDLFASLAEETNASFQILAFDADLNDIAQRLEQRQKMKQVSDADLAIAKSQLENIDPLTETERKHTQFITKNEIAEFIRN